MTAERDADFQAEITRLKAIIQRQPQQIGELIIAVHHLETRGSDE